MMNRYDIKNKKTGVITHSYQADAEMPHQPEWGLLQRNVWDDEASDEQKADAISSQQVQVGTDENNQPVMRTQLTLPQTYDVIVTDITGEIQQQSNDAWIAARNQQTENDIKALLSGREKETIISFALMDIYTVMNWNGNFTPEQIAAAKADADQRAGLFQQIQNLMTTRDQEIAAYVAAHPVS